MNTPETPYEGDRFKVCDASDYYTVECNNLPGVPDHQPAWGILDEEDGGYIAFTTSEELAERIKNALML